MEIGSNTCVDRGSVDDTVIGRGTKIDNLVQVGHNVRIGARCLVMARRRASPAARGSATTSILGGQVGVADHLTIGDGARIARQERRLRRRRRPAPTISGYPGAAAPQIACGRRRRCTGWPRSSPELEALVRGAKPRWLGARWRGTPIVAGRRAAHRRRDDRALRRRGSRAAASSSAGSTCRRARDPGARRRGARPPSAAPRSATATRRSTPSSTCWPRSAPSSSTTSSSSSTAPSRRSLDGSFAPCLDGARRAPASPSRRASPWSTGSPRRSS